MTGTLREHAIDDTVALGRAPDRPRWGDRRGQPPDSTGIQRFALRRVEIPRID